ncbi:unnamed protein product [Sympodiomycopsis kandeliae]
MPVKMYSYATICFSMCECTICGCFEPNLLLTASETLTFTFTLLSLTSDTMADSLLYTTLHSTLSYIIPAQIFYPLAKFSNLCYQVILGVSNDPSSWSSTLLPPLIALVAGYIALLIAYRTLRSTIALIFWSIKWGIIIGVLLAGYSIYTGRADAIHSIGRVPWTRAISGVINQVFGR